MKGLWKYIILLAGISVFASAQDNGVLFLVRHAERDAAGGDAALLNQVGEQRAQCLARTLELAGITKIYVTDIKRTQQTAAPLAAELHLHPTVVPHDNVNQLVKDLESAGNAKILVVAHADTLPKILEQLGGRALPPSKPNEQNYDYLLIIPMRDGKAQSLSVVRYCPAAAETAK
jgi:broad specificity phosphatase PhoE